MQKIIDGVYSVQGLMAEAWRSVHKAADILCLGHGKPVIGSAASVLRAFAKKVNV